MTASSAASRRVLTRTPVAPLPASSPTRPTGITGRMSASPETSSPEVCSFRLPQMRGFRLPLTAVTIRATTPPGVAAWAKTSLPPLQLGDFRSEKVRILRRRCRHRPVQYSNNILEQAHRAIKRRVTPKQGFRAFHAARRTIRGYETMHMIRKGQARWVSGSNVRRQIQFINKLFGVAASDGAWSTRPIHSPASF